jgi:hypothetical protein
MRKRFCLRFFVPFVLFCGLTSSAFLWPKNVRTRTCSPLHIRALTRPLIFQCVTDLYRHDLVAMVIPVLVSKFVSVKRRSTSACDRTDERALLTTEQSTKQCTSTNACGRRQLISVLIPKRSIPTSIPVNLISITRISNALFVPLLINSSISCLRSDRNRGQAQRQQTNDT